MIKEIQTASKNKPTNETKELACKCGNDLFHMATNKMFLMCSLCHTVYSWEGKEIEVNHQRVGRKIVHIGDNA